MTDAMQHANAEVDQEERSRRKFLVFAAIAALSLSILEALRITLAYLQPGPKEGFGGDVNAGPLGDIAKGSVKHIKKGRFYLLSLDEGLLALYQGCTHLGCLVPWDDGEGVFKCPCHAGRYNRLGEVVSGPPPRPLDTFAVSLVDGEVIVDTSKRRTRDGFDLSQVTEV